MSQEPTTPPPADHADEPPDHAEVDASTGPEPVGGAAVAFVMPAPVCEAVETEINAGPAIVNTTESVAALGDESGLRSDGAIQTLGERFERGFEELKALFQREIRAETTREKVIDRLHAELQEYKQDLLLNTLRPVFIDLIQLHDDIGKVAIRPLRSEGEGDDPTESDRLVGLMEGFQQGIEDILYRQGVEPFEVDGEAFDPRRQELRRSRPSPATTQAAEQDRPRGENPQRLPIGRPGDPAGDRFGLRRQEVRGRSGSANDRMPDRPEGTHPQMTQIAADGKRENRIGMQRKRKEDEQK